VREEKVLVSAIVSAYNSEKFMRGRLQNLVDQTLFEKKQLEIIVIDSNSLEREKRIVETFMSKYEHVRYFRTAMRETVYGAWNRGIRLADGRYVINANTDDRFATDALEQMADLLNSDVGVDGVYGDWMVTKIENDSFDSDSEKFVFHYPEFFPPLFFYYQITSHAPLFRKEVFRKIGFYDDNFKVFGDRDFMFRFSTLGLKAKKIPSVVGLYLENETGLERSGASPGAEFVSIRERYLAPKRFVRLFGYDSIPERKELAWLYSMTGSLGKDFYRWDGRPVNDFSFSARLFGKALELDSSNTIALNNLGIILCVLGRRREGIHLFQKGLELNCVPYSDAVSTNLALAKAGCEAIEEYAWVKPKESHLSS